jgi:hypothetical protein
LHAIPALGSKRIIDLRRADVAKLHGKLLASPYQANRAVARGPDCRRRKPRHVEPPNSR